ncbi:tetraacyldisaccharide 4'-kinase [Ferrovibrio sp.]|uniref:tetraacyldisaccharide 4'-kinase n=1 Tax=Ferrovibrio sp. TaxID=1917215 RepID=UPI003D13FA4C
MPRTPDFWSAGTTSSLPALLSPLALLYGLGNRLNRALAQPQEVAVPVISVGNLVAGGAGKTPTAIALAARLKAMGRLPAIISRGYGGSEAGPLRVDPSLHTAALVGDEALLLARAAPTWIGRDRPDAARAACRAGCDILLADDAHQTYALERDINLLVVDAAQGFGNGCLLPAGPLREGIAEGLERADAVILIGQPAQPFDFGALPVFAAALQPLAADAAMLKDERVLAFAGIGRPEKFFATLESIGAHVAERQAFPDHGAYDTDTVMRLVERAVALKAQAVTTEKDLMRLPPEARAMVQVLRVELVFEAPGRIEAFITEALTDA